MHIGVLGRPRSSIASEGYGNSLSYEHIQPGKTQSVEVWKSHPLAT